MQPNEIIVHTKSDLASRDPSPSNESQTQVRVSAITGDGLEALRAAIADRLSNRAVSLAADALALQPRHEAAMRSAMANLDEALTLVAGQRAARHMAHPELIASSLHVALDELAGLAGEMTPDDILGRIFATFCIGK